MLKEALGVSGQHGTQALRDVGVNRLSSEQAQGILRQRLDMQ